MIGFKNAQMLSDTLAIAQPVLDEHRGVRAVAVDTSVWKVKLDDKLAATKPKRKEGQKEKAYIICIARRSGSQSRAGTFLRLTGNTSLSAEHLEVFLDRCAAGKNLVAMAEAPRISLRPPDQPKAYSPPASSSPAPSKSGKTAPKSKSTTGSSSQSKRPMPRYSRADDGKSSKQGAFSKSHESRKGGRSQDRVGSRSNLEEEEPLFSVLGSGEVIH